MEIEIYTERERGNGDIYRGKSNFLFRFSRPIPRQDDLDRAGLGVVLKQVPPEQSALSDKAAMAAWAALSRSGPLRLSGEPALFI